MAVASTSRLLQVDTRVAVAAASTVGAASAPSSDARRRFTDSVDGASARRARASSSVSSASKSVMAHLVGARGRGGGRRARRAGACRRC